MPLSLVCALALLTSPLDFYDEGPYESSVLKPDQVLGYLPGARHTTFREQELVFQSFVQRAPHKIKAIEYGHSVEGRPLRIYAISSPKNLEKLEQIKSAHGLLATGKGNPKSSLPIVWINECIHGNETASFEAGMYTAYNLVASQNPALQSAMNQVVVIINPVYNPDGHERYVVYYNSLAVGSSDPAAFETFEPSTVHGRENHYRFDMNRDRVAFSQDETRTEFAEMLKWHPQVYIDQHGQVPTYFFPPEPMSINPNVDRARNAKWTEIFGRAIGEAFDQRGMSYYTRNEFDLYYPGYLDASTTLSGAIGMTHETDGGRLLATQRDDGSILTLRRGIEKHFTSALAVVKAAAEHHNELMESYATFEKRVVSGEAAGKFKRVVVTGGDPRPLGRLKKHLGFAGIRSAFLSKPMTQPDATDYWTGQKSIQTFPAGSLVIDMNQSQGALAKALLESGSGFEPEFTKDQAAKIKSAPADEKYPGPDSPEFYDLTGWSLPLAYDLPAWSCETLVPAEVIEEASAPTVNPSPSTAGYILGYHDIDDILAVAEALSSGVKALQNMQEMTLAGKTYPEGSFLFLADRNDPGFESKLFEACSAHHCALMPITTSFPDGDSRNGPGSSTTIALKAPEIGVIFGSGSNLGNVGAIWYLLDREFKLPFTPLRIDRLDRELHEFTTLIVPCGTGFAMSSKLRDWIQDGGSLVVLGEPGWAIGSSGAVSLETVKGELQSLPGSLFKAQIDPRSFLSFGYERDASGKVTIAVPIEGNTFYTARKEGGSVVTLPDSPSGKLLNGWEWPNETEKALQNTVFLQDAPMGRGHALIFTGDPTARAMWPGLYKLLLNAMIVGSGR